MIRTIAGFAVFLSLGVVAFEVWKKTQAAKVTVTGGLQQVSKVAAQPARILPFGTLPILSGGSNVPFAQVLTSSLAGLLAPSHSVPAIGAPVDSSPFGAPTLYTGPVVPTDADLAAFGVSPATPAFNEQADLDAYYGN